MNEWIYQYLVNASVYPASGSTAKCYYLSCYAVNIVLVFKSLVSD